MTSTLATGTSRPSSAKLVAIRQRISPRRKPSMASRRFRAHPGIAEDQAGDLQLKRLAVLDAGDNHERRFGWVLLNGVHDSGIPSAVGDHPEGHARGRRRLPEKVVIGKSREPAPAITL